MRSTMRLWRPQATQRNRRLLALEKTLVPAVRTVLYARSTASPLMAVTVALVW